jgi:RNA polymerase sigma-70 factor (ECF subfamily)
VTASTAEDWLMTLGRSDAALHTVVHRDSGRLYRIAFSVLRDQDEAEDAVQETWIKVWRGWDWAHDGTPPSAWLTRVCVNHCLNRRRGLLLRFRTMRRAGQLQAATNVSPPAVGHLDLARAYGTLSVKQRAAVALHYYHGFSVDECAEFMGCRPGTVRSHLARALGGLREEMNGD